MTKSLSWSASAKVCQISWACWQISGHILLVIVSSRTSCWKPDSHISVLWSKVTNCSQVGILGLLNNEHDCAASRIPLIQFIWGSERAIPNISTLFLMPAVNVQIILNRFLTTSKPMLVTSLLFHNYAKNFAISNVIMVTWRKTNMHN